MTMAHCRSGRAALAALAFLLTSTTVAVADETERVDSPTAVATGAARDAAYIATAPLRINKKGALLVGAALATIYATTFIDRPVRNAMDRLHPSSRRDRLGDFGDRNEDVEFLGRSTGALLTSGAFFAGGVAFRNKKAKRVGLMGVEAWFFTDLLIKGFKKGIGRERPSDDGPYRFRPFHGGDAMPSGHAATAFCMASVIASEYDSPWIDAASYGTAGAVAAGRLYRGVHWTSDLVAAAILGITVGKTVHHLYGRDAEGWKVIFAGDRIVLARAF